MIPLLLVSSLLVQLATAAPTNTTSEVPYSDATSNYRSVWSILGTCAVTLFICIWNAIHPNTIAQGKCPCASALYQGALMLMTLFVPEFTVARACTEWVYARRIERDFHEYRWTPTHGFFSLMGGFVLDDGTKQTTLRPCNHLEHLRDGKLVNQDITAEEIDDKSKSDGLAKVILGLQLSWFVLQVIVRGTNHLAITLVEIDTLAMTAVTFPLFFFWWNKPMAPKRPHTLRLKLSQDVPAIHRSPDDDDDEGRPFIVDLSVRHMRYFREGGESAGTQQWVGRQLLLPELEEVPKVYGSLVFFWLLDYFGRSAHDRVGLPIPKST